MAKRFFISVAAAILLLFPAKSFAQFYAGAGYLNSKMNVHSDESYLNLNFNGNGFYITAGYSINLGGGFALTPALTFQQFKYDVIDFSYEMDDYNVGINSFMTEQYITVPFHLSFGHQISDDIRIFAFAGPSVAWGITSKIVAKSSFEGISMDETFDNYKEEVFSPLDVSAGGGAGIDLLGHYRITASYDYGLMNRYLDPEEGSANRKWLQVGLAYIF